MSLTTSYAYLPKYLIDYIYTYICALTAAYHAIPKNAQRSPTFQTPRVFANSCEASFSDTSYIQTHKVRASSSCTNKKSTDDVIWFEHWQQSDGRCYSDM